MELILEVNEGNTDETFRAGNIMMTPIVSPDYWLFRVRLAHDQAILGFPKFSTIGVGFAIEEDWNTNLPYTVSAEEIYDHIDVNKAYDDITADDCIAAIRLIQEAAARYDAMRAA